MIRRLGGYAVVAIIGLVMMKLLLGVIGLALSLVWTLLWLAAIGFVFYLILRIVSPPAAQRVREWVRGESEASD